MVVVVEVVVRTMAAQPLLVAVMAELAKEMVSVLQAIPEAVLVDHLTTMLVPILAVSAALVLLLLDM
jgi:hypothetical protein